jgi:hypothetical protein
MNATKIDWEKEVERSAEGVGADGADQLAHADLPRGAAPPRGAEQGGQPLGARRDHELLQLLDTPNPFYSGETLMMVTGARSRLR